MMASYISKKLSNVACFSVHLVSQKTFNLDLVICSALFFPVLNSSTALSNRLLRFGEYAKNIPSFLSVSNIICISGTLKLLQSTRFNS